MRAKYNFLEMFLFWKLKKNWVVFAVLFVWRFWFCIQNVHFFPTTQPNIYIPIFKTKIFLDDNTLNLKHFCPPFFFVSLVHMCVFLKKCSPSEKIKLNFIHVLVNNSVLPTHNNIKIEFFKFTIIQVYYLYNKGTLRASSCKSE